MGWKGAMRSMAAASRAAERNAQRRYKANAKAQELANSASAVEDWEDYVESLVSIHTNMADNIDWQSVANSERPSEPTPLFINGDTAKATLAKFKPGFFDFFSGGSEKIRRRMEQEVSAAVRLDEQRHEAALAAHAKALVEWLEDKQLAESLLRGEATAIRQILEERQSLSDEALLGTAVEFFIADRFIHACPQVHSESVVPSMRRKQLASGRLSESKMPTAQFNELYQDYVCSVSLKTAGDLFHILPLNEVYVTCKAYMLDPQTGHQSWTPILSVQFVRESFMRLNLNGIDPSDAMRNFRHSMIFSKTKGFSAVDTLPIPATTPIN